MNKYIIYDVCEDPSPATYSDELGKAISKERFIELLTMEIESYYECYEDAESLKEQFIQNMTEVLQGRPIQINGMEFHIEVEG